MNRANVNCQAHPILLRGVRAAGERKSPGPKTPLTTGVLNVGPSLPGPPSTSELGTNGQQQHSNVFCLESSQPTVPDHRSCHGKTPVAAGATPLTVPASQQPVGAVTLKTGRNSSPSAGHMPQRVQLGRAQANGPAPPSSTVPSLHMSRKPVVASQQPLGAMTAEKMPASTASAAHMPQQVMYDRVQRDDLAPPSLAVPSLHMDWALMAASQQAAGTETVEKGLVAAASAAHTPFNMRQGHVGGGAATLPGSAVPSLQSPLPASQQPLGAMTAEKSPASTAPAAMPQKNRFEHVQRDALATPSSGVPSMHISQGLVAGPQQRIASVTVEKAPASTASAAYAPQHVRLGSVQGHALATPSSGVLSLHMKQGPVPASAQPVGAVNVENWPKPTGSAAHALQQILRLGRKQGYAPALHSSTVPSLHISQGPGPASQQPGEAATNVEGPASRASAAHAPEHVRLGHEQGNANAQPSCGVPSLRMCHVPVRASQQPLGPLGALIAEARPAHIASATHMPQQAKTERPAGGVLAPPSCAEPSLHLDRALVPASQQPLCAPESSKAPAASIPQQVQLEDLQEPPASCAAPSLHPIQSPGPSPQQPAGAAALWTELAATSAANYTPQQRQVEHMLRDAPAEANCVVPRLHMSQGPVPDHLAATLRMQPAPQTALSSILLSGSDGNGVPMRLGATLEPTNATPDTPPHWPWSHQCSHAT